MLRYSLLFLFIASLSAYAFKDWFKSLCGLVFLMAVLERDDMPRTMLGIPGMNPFNILLLFVLFNWMSSKAKENRQWDLPKHIYWILWIYLVVIVISLFRLMGRLPDFRDFYASIDSAAPGVFKLILDYLVNCIKWVIPAVLIYDGCRDEKRATFLINTLLVTFLVVAVQIISRMGFGAVLDSKVLQQKAVRVLVKNPGYHRVDLAAMMAGAAWTVFCAHLLYRGRKFKQLLCLAGSGVCFLALILTAGRTGYGAWALIGLFFAWCRWKILLVVGPICIAVAVAFVPAARDRLFEGFTEDSHQGGVSERLGTVDDSGRDAYAITSGRAVVWPFVLSEINKAPIFGHGGKAFLTTGAATEVFELIGAPWAHPHNAYLEFFIDNGLVGLVPVLLLYLMTLRYSFRLFMDDDPRHVVIGSTCFALISTHMISAIGAQSFYPKAGLVFMWVAMGACWRFYFFSPFKSVRKVKDER